MKNVHILKQAILFILFVTVVVFTKEFAKSYLLEIGIDSYNTHLCVKIIFNIILIIASLLTIKKLDLFEIGGLSSIKLQKPWLLIFPFVYLVALNSLFSNPIPNYTIVNIFLLILYCFTIGFSEELSFRSVILPLILKLSGKSTNKYLLAVLLSSLIFGLLHLINFNKGIYGEVSQVFFATFIGFMFGALLLITKRIYPLIIIHALIDFTAKLDSIDKPIKETVYDPMNIESATFTVILVLPCLIYGLFILKKHLKKNEYEIK